MGKDCTQVRKLFQQANDIRGQVSWAPNIKSSSRNKMQKQIVEKWLQRTSIHWKTSSYNQLSSACNQKEKENLPASSRTRSLANTTNQAGNKQSKVPKIGLWHYHPKLIQKYCTASNKSIPKAIPVKEMQSLGLYNGGGRAGDDSLYTLSDTIVDEENNRLVLTLPIYSLSQSLVDAQESKNAYDISFEVEVIKNRQSRKQPIRHINLQGNDCHTHSTETSTTPSNGIRKRKQTMTKAELKNDNERLMKRTKELERQLRHEKKEHHKQKEMNDKLLERIDWLEKCIQESEQIGKESDLNFAFAKDANLQSSMTHDLELFEKSGAGLNRISITSREFLAKKECKRLCNTLYGFEDFDLLLCLIEAFFDIQYKQPTQLLIDPHNPLSECEQVLLTLLWSNVTWNNDIVGLMFGIRSRKTVEAYIYKWLPLIGERGDMMSDFLPFLDSEAYEKLNPQSYIDLELDDICAVLDGKDYPCETVRSNRVLNCAQSSNKTHGSAFRNLTWSLPCGGVIERTPGFLGRASEKGIMAVWGSMGRLIFPKGSLILADKGFDNLAAYYTNFNTSLHPSFLHNKKFSEEQVNYNIKICQKRYSCEVVYSRVAMVGKLSGNIKREWFVHFESLLGWAHGRANLAYGYLQPIRDEELYK